MAAFQSDINYALELAYRTRLNMLVLLRHEFLETNQLERADEISDQIHILQQKMEERALTALPFCNGTQIVNSFLGFLVVPKESFFKKMSRFKQIQDWQTYLPTLYKYVQNKNTNVFYNRYAYKNRYGQFEYERNTIRNVLRHLRNAVCHDKLSMHPLSDEQNREVTHIVFRDCAEDTEEKRMSEGFYIKISCADVVAIQEELVYFYERIAEDELT